MTSQLISAGLFVLVLIGSFDSLEAMTQKMENFQVPIIQIEADEYLYDPEEEAEINYLLDDLDRTYAQTHSKIAGLFWRSLL